MGVLDGVEKVRDVLVEVLCEERLLHDGEAGHYALQGFQRRLKHLTVKEWSEEEESEVQVWEEKARWRGRGKQVEDMGGREGGEAG